MSEQFLCACDTDPDDAKGDKAPASRQIKKHSIGEVLQALPAQPQGEMDWGRPCGKEPW